MAILRKLLDLVLGRPKLDEEEVERWVERYANAMIAELLDSTAGAIKVEVLKNKPSSWIVQHKGEDGKRTSVFLRRARIDPDKSPEKWEAVSAEKQEALSRLEIRAGTAPDGTLYVYRNY